MKTLVGVTICLLAAAQALAEPEQGAAENSGASSTAQMGEREVTIKALEVAPGVYSITGAGGNMGLVTGDDGAFLIDDQYAPLTEGILQVIAQLTDKPVKFVLNTHYHGDHTGGNENLGAFGTLVVAHDNVRVRMSQEQFSTFWERTTPPEEPGALPVVTFSDAVTFHLNGMRVRAFHVANAHTDGDAIVHLPDVNVIHMGDVFFHEWYPYIDVSAGGSIRGTLVAVDNVLDMIDKETVVIPGHGDSPTDRMALVAYRDMLSAVADRIQTLIDQGKSLEEVQAAAPTAQWDAVWGQNFMSPERFVRLVYGHLKGTL